jgi:MAternally-affected-uncoordination protein
MHALKVEVDGKLLISELYRELEERSNEMENHEYERKKEDDLQRRLSEAYSQAFHQELVR